MNTLPLGWTTVEQSKKLLEAGLDIQTADMHFWESEGKVYTYIGRGDDNNCQPCWSLGKLIDLMPKGIETKKPKNLYFLDIYPASSGVAYTATGKQNDFIFLQHFTDKQFTLIENIVSMICWLLKKGYTKKGDIK